MKTVEIKFTKEQYEKLIKLLYLGDWVVNSHRVDDRIEEFDDLEQYIYSSAKGLRLTEYIIYDEKYKKYFATRKFEKATGLDGYIDEYNDMTFLEELINRLAERDMEQEYGKDARKKMKQEKLFSIMDKFRNKYEEEFSQMGIKNLILKE